MLTNSAAAQSYENYGNQQTNNVQNDNKIEQLSHGGGSVVNNVYESTIDLDSGYNNGNTIYISNSKRPASSSSPSSIYESTNKTPTSHYFIDNDSVIVSSASPSPLTSTQHSAQQHDDNDDNSMYLPSTGTSHEQNYSPEIPGHIPTGMYGSNEMDSNETNSFTADALVQNSNENINEQGQDFTHSDISHPGFDAVLLDEIEDNSNSYSPSTERFSTENPYPSIETITTHPTAKVTYAKPGFKPKTKPTLASSTHNNDDRLVLVQTISNNKEKPMGAANDTGKPVTTGTMSENDIESIESIILMLNDTKTGPQYNSVDNSVTATESPMDYSDTTAYSSSSTGANIYSTQMTHPTGIDYNKYGQNSYFITTRIPTTLPKLPPNGYVYTTHHSTQHPPTINEPMYVQSTIASSYGAVTPEYLSSPLYQNVPNNLHPMLLTSSSFRPHPSTQLPTTSYVIGDSVVTKRPIAYDQATTTIGTKKPTAAVTPVTKKTKKPSNIVKNTKKPPSTSYVTGPTTPRPYKTNPTHKQPQVVTSTTQASMHNSQTPTVIVLGPTYNDYSSTTEHLPVEHIVQSKPIKQQTNFQPEPPTPTIHITPKPTVNLVTASTWSQKPSLVTKYTAAPPPPKQPVASYIYHTPIGTYRPAIQTSTPTYQFDYGSPVNYGSTSPAYIKPINQQNGIYRPGFYSTQRPSAGGPLFSSPGYGGDSVAVVPSGNPAYGSPQPYPGFFGSTATYPQAVEYSTLKDEYFTSPNDVNNFPPVRNPNLNVSAATLINGQPVFDEYDFSTPHFVENDALKDKMGLLVSKIVESLQDNFDDLADVVYESNKTNSQKPAAAGTATTIVTARPTIVTKRPVVKITTKKPVVRPLADDAVGAGSKPSATSKPSAKPTTKRPTSNKITTRKPTTNSQNVKKTTKKPATTVTTKKPLTKVNKFKLFA